MNRLKKRLLLFTVAALTVGTTAISATVDQLKYYNALQFRMINKPFADSKTPFFRLPAAINDTVRDGLRVDGEMSAGLAVRFATNATAIGVKYELTLNFKMSHRAYTGIKGTDLYVLDGDRWQFVNCSKPADAKEQNRVYVSNMEPVMREYMIYLPLYDGIKSIEIGVDSAATITQPMVDNPRSDRKIVFYGTSVTQGGCASRPGMLGTSIIQRDLNAEVVNLGFSGEGRMDPFMAEAMARIPGVTAYVIDAVANCSHQRLDTICETFVNILRQARPDVPIFLAERHQFTNEHYDTVEHANFIKANTILHRHYMALRKQNPKNLYYIDHSEIFGPDNEGAVDGAHLTDLGFFYYAHKFEPYLKAVLNGKKIPNQKHVNSDRYIVK